MSRGGQYFRYQDTFGVSPHGLRGFDDVYGLLILASETLVCLDPFYDYEGEIKLRLNPFKELKRL